MEIINKNKLFHPINEAISPTVSLPVDIYIKNTIKYCLPIVYTRFNHVRFNEFQKTILMLITTFTIAWLK
jgi:hypothetical protein